MSSVSRRTFVGGAGAVCAGAFLCACGGQSDGGTSAVTDGATTKLTFCLDYTPNTNHTGIYVAQAKGYFADEGLEVQIVQPAEGTAEMLIGSGQAEVGVSYQDYLADSLVAGNTDIAAVAAVVQHNTGGIMSRAEDGITRPAAMEGHTYATWDTPIEQATIRQIVEDDGGDYDKVVLVPYTVEDDVAGLTTKGAKGKYPFDTVWVYEGWAVQNARLQGIDVNYFSFISIDDDFDYYTPVIAANLSFAQENPEAIKAFLRAAKKGYEFAVENPDEAAEVLCGEVPELDPELVTQSQAYLSEKYVDDAESWGVIDGDRWAKYYTWLNDNELLEEKLDPNAGWTMDYLQ